MKRPNFENQWTKASFRYTISEEEALSNYHELHLALTKMPTDSEFPAEFRLRFYEEFFSLLTETAQTELTSEIVPIIETLLQKTSTEICPYLFYLLGQFYTEKQILPKAIHYLEQAQKEDDSHWLENSQKCYLHFFLGMNFFLEEKWEQAQKHFILGENSNKRLPNEQKLFFYFFLKEIALKLHQMKDFDMYSKQYQQRLERISEENLKNECLNFLLPKFISEIIQNEHKNFCEN